MNWPEYFEHNERTRREIPWDLGITVDKKLRDPLIRSLQRFQLSESGDGIHIRRGAASVGNAEYITSINCFLKEEAIHAETLDRVLKIMNAPLLKSHWSHNCFVFARRFLGFHVELAVILVAEMVAMRYYQILHRGITDPVLNTIFAQMVHDEAKHLEFHYETLHQWLKNKSLMTRSILRTGLRMFYQMAFLAVVYDHRELMRALEVPPGDFLRECDALFTYVIVQLFREGKGVHTPIIAMAGAEPV